MQTILDYFAAIEWTVFNNVLKAVGIFILGWIVSKWAARIVRKQLSKTTALQVNDTLRPLIVTFVRYTIFFVTLYAALTTAGIQAASLLAVLGAAGLAVALAVQGTLSNVAAGIMLIFLRAIKVGDYIQTPDLEGTVLEIGLFITQIQKSNGVSICVPNAQIWAKHVINYSRNTERRVDIIISLSRDNDLDKAHKTLQTALSKSKHILKPDSASVALVLITTHTADFQARCWVSSDDVRGHLSDLNLELHAIVRKNGFKLPPTLSV
ncbi:MAG: small-conductance mechanosensitive channel [Robiginitomaculum sp.]|nr:MAG: small-conductance mechanosensitive channel [Robiginitomaculum sp.]